MRKLPWGKPLHQHIEMTLFHIFYACNAQIASCDISFAPTLWGWIFAHRKISSPGELECVTGLGGTPWCFFQFFDIFLLTGMILFLGTKVAGNLHHRRSHFVISSRKMDAKFGIGTKKMLKNFLFRSFHAVWVKISYFGGGFRTFFDGIFDFVWRFSGIGSAIHEKWVEPRKPPRSEDSFSYFVFSQKCHISYSEMKTVFFHDLGVKFNENSRCLPLPTV